MNDKLRLDVVVPIWSIGALFTMGLLLGLSEGDLGNAKWWQLTPGVIVTYAVWPLILGVLTGFALKSAGY